MNHDIKIGYETAAELERAQELAASLNIEIDNEADHRLLVMSNKIALKMKGFKPLCADFNSGIWQKRRQEGKQQGLVKACKPGPGIHIIDATAGWGRDAAVLASFGAEVILLEREPIMGALLEDALRRQDEHSKAVLKLRLIKTDAFDYLNGLSENNYPDVIYIDPMHPERQKAALVKKDLQALQEFIKPNTDSLELIELAKSRVKNRVVLKWPQSLPTLFKPTYSIPGKTVRFDVYC
ncbi:class I SAM-dependent methyltransferase [Legionella jordanis]|uniref:Ribosomal RNA small subunit methyltransferase J n=1 Tax=Legionella jordanis TaxID=456 RepID=A0A0W0V9Z1_9GAMM|nr:class I SAM-dependent methyltransferase [Legionella jordanis]KTD16685.1 SAM-dependent methyltransferase [Legionella jordanis]RMX03783.1 SAM-dependent methyltransferase [Legionella jordanis]RMX22156.1 SAM-dependent methyltransferase [Legionella jordanis]VEH11847.1 N6-adenine-specific methylase [Legionella jordanis]